MRLLGAIADSWLCRPTVAGQVPATFLGGTADTCSVFSQMRLGRVQFFCGKWGE